MATGTEFAYWVLSLAWTCRTIWWVGSIFLTTCLVLWVIQCLILKSLIAEIWVYSLILICINGYCRNYMWTICLSADWPLEIVPISTLSAGIAFKFSALRITYKQCALFHPLSILPQLISIETWKTIPVWRVVCHTKGVHPLALLRSGWKIEIAITFSALAILAWLFAVWVRGLEDRTLALGWEELVALITRSASAKVVISVAEGINWNTFGELLNNRHIKFGRTPDTACRFTLRWVFFIFNTVRVQKLLLFHTLTRDIYDGLLAFVSRLNKGIACQAEFTFPVCRIKNALVLAASWAWLPRVIARRTFFTFLDLKINFITMIYFHLFFALWTYKHFFLLALKAARIQRRGNFASFEKFKTSSVGEKKITLSALKALSNVFQWGWSSFGTVRIVIDTSLHKRVIDVERPTLVTNFSHLIDVVGNIIEDSNELLCRVGCQIVGVGWNDCVDIHISLRMYKTVRIYTSVLQLWILGYFGLNFEIFGETSNTRPGLNIMSPA